MRENLGALDAPVARRHPRGRLRARRLLDLRQPAAALDGALREDGRPRQAERPASPRSSRTARRPRSRRRTSGCARADADDGRGPRRQRTVTGVSLPEVRAGARAVALRRPGARRSAASAATSWRSTATRSSRGAASPPRTSTRRRRSRSSAPRPCRVFFPTGDAVGQRSASATSPCRSSGVLEERVFRCRKSRATCSRWRNRIIARPDDARGAPVRGGPVPARRPRRRSGSATSTRWRRSPKGSRPRCSRRTTASRRTSASTTSPRA